VSSSSQVPAFRPDLQVQRVVDQGGVFYDIFDPRTGQTQRLYEAEYVVAQKLDGQRSVRAALDQLRQAAELELGEAEFGKVITQLRSMGLLSAAGDRLPPAPALLPRTPDPLPKKRRRGPWAVGGILVLLLVAGAVGWLRPWQSRRVSVQTLRLQAFLVPAYFPSEVQRAGFAHDAWLSFDVVGRLDQLPPPVGSVVAAGDVLGRLKLSAVHQRAYVAAQGRLRRLQATVGRSTRYLNQLLAQRLQVEAHLVAAGPRAAKRGRLGRPIDRALQTLVRRERLGRAKLARILHAEAGAQIALRQLQHRLRRQLLVARFAGEVSGLSPGGLQLGQVLLPRIPLVRLRDPQNVEVVLRFAGPAPVHPGDSLLLSIAHASPLLARALAVEPNGALRLEAAVGPGIATLMDAPRSTWPPDSFRVVERQLAGVFRVPSQSLVGGPEKPQLFEVVDGKLVGRRVEAVEQQGGDVFVRSVDAALHEGASVAVGRADGGALSGLREGSRVRSFAGAAGP
jgi:hypothetical protein